MPGPCSESELDVFIEQVETHHGDWTGGREEASVRTRGYALVSCGRHDKVPQAVAENHGNVPVHTLREQESEIEVSAGLAPSGGCEGEPSPGLSPSFRWRLAIPGVPRLVDAPP